MDDFEPVGEFLSTHPGRGATLRDAWVTYIPAYFYPRTPGGVRRLPPPLPSTRKRNFYPRTPGGVRLFVPDFGLPVLGPISIHAPRAGCDHHRGRGPAVAVHFYPRTPGGVRLRVVGRKPGRVYFYPRTPGGVRPKVCCASFANRLISIHAPRAGCDCVWRVVAQQCSHFYPRTPGGVRPRKHRNSANGI